MKRGFSLLEMLIVMSIIGFLIAIGVAGLITLRTNMEAQQAINEVMSYLKDTQNKAKNNSVAYDVTLEEMKTNSFGYQIFTSDDGFLHRAKCKKEIADNWTIGECSIAGVESLKSNSFANVKISNINFPGPPAIIYGCNSDPGVLFENLTGKIWYLPASGYATSGTSCAISISIISPAYDYAWVIFDTASGIYTLQKP